MAGSRKISRLAKKLTRALSGQFDLLHYTSKGKKFFTRRELATESPFSRSCK